MKNTQIVNGRASGLVLALALATTAFSTQNSYAEDLTVTVFGGRLGETLKTVMITPFREETGLDVVTDDRDWGIGVVRTRIEGGSNTWDVVATEDIEAIQGCDEGLFAELDKSMLPNLDKYAVEPLDCGLPQVLYNMGIAYRKDSGTDAPKDWTDFWDVEKWPGKRSMYKSPRDSLEAALLADGVAREDVYDVLSTEEGVNRAFDKLGELKPNLIWWTNAGQARQMQASGETVMSATFDSGIHYMNKNEGTNLGVVLKDAITHVDYWVIVNGTPQLENAYKFLQYASQAEPQSGISNTMYLSVPNQDSLALTEEAMRPLLSANPDNRAQALESSAKFWLDNFDALNRRFESWIAQ